MSCKNVVDKDKLHQNEKENLIGMHHIDNITLFLQFVLFGVAFKEI